MTKKLRGNETLVGVVVKNPFLEDFDKAIKGRFSTRSEAVRQGMRLLLDKLREEKK